MKHWKVTVERLLPVFGPDRPLGVNSGMTDTLWLDEPRAAANAIQTAYILTFWNYLLLSFSPQKCISSTWERKICLYLCVCMCFWVGGCFSSSDSGYINTLTWCVAPEIFDIHFDCYPWDQMQLLLVRVTNNKPTFSGFFVLFFQLWVKVKCIFVKPLPF